MLNAKIPEQDMAAAGGKEHTAAVRGALAALSLAMLLSSLGISVANVALPTLAQAFDATFQQVQWVVLAYLLAITALIVGVGRLGDITGRRRLLLGGIVLFMIASALGGFAPTLGLLISARLAQGLGAAIMMALAMALVGETVPKEKTGSAIGLLGTMSAIGTTLGPSVGGVLISGLGWRAIFLLNVPIGIAAFLLARRYLPVDRREPKCDRANFDLVGTLLLTLTLAAYALAMTMGRGRFDALNVSLLLTAALGLGLFVFAEARVASPLIRLAMFREPALSAGLAMSALVSTVMMATLVVGPFYLSRALGLNAAMVGLALSIGPLVTALMGVPSGRMADRFGAQRMILVGLSGIAAGSCILTLLPAKLGLLGFLAPIVVITSGYALFQTANNTAVMTGLRADQRGVVSGLLNLSRNLGLVTGASAMGAVFAFASATTDLTTARPETVATGMRTTFAVAAFLIVVALAIGLGGRAHSRRRTARASKRRACGMDTARPTPTSSSRKSDWLIAGGLIAVSVIPMVGGGFRLVELGSGAATTPDHVRFVAAPWSLVSHIVSSAIFGVLGAFQFAPKFRRRSPRWHRVAGRVLVLSGLVAAFTGLWMTQFRPPADFTGSFPASFDGPSLYVVRLLAGSAMAFSLCLGVTAVWRRDIASHQAWMIRAYALGLGASTQAFTHLPWFLFPSIQGELARTLCMGTGWAINIAVAEWLIWRARAGRASKDVGQTTPATAVAAT